MNYSFLFNNRTSSTLISMNDCISRCEESKFIFYNNETVTYLWLLVISIIIWALKLFVGFYPEKFNMSEEQAVQLYKILDFFTPVFIIIYIVAVRYLFL